MRGCLLLLGLGVLAMMMAGTHGMNDVLGLSEREEALMEMDSGVQDNIVEREVRAIKQKNTIRKTNQKKSDQRKTQTNKTNEKNMGVRKIDGKNSNAKKAKKTKDTSRKTPQKQKTPQNKKTVTKKGLLTKKGKASEVRKTKQNKKTATKKGKTSQVRKNQSKPQQTEQTEDTKDIYGRQISAWESCDVNTVNDTCLQNALDSLEFEKNQIQNFFKQQSRAKGHNKTIGGKRGKKDEFNAAAVLMLDALGGDISNASCNGNSDSEAALAAVANYNVLNNCSATIEEACTMPTETYSAEITAQLDDCATIFSTSKSISDDCRNSPLNQQNGTNACICWANAAIGIKAAKKAGCKAQSTAKGVKQQKAKCLEAFGECKKAEDNAVAQIHGCMAGGLKTLEEAAKDLVSRRVEEESWEEDYVYTAEYPDLF